MSTADEGRTPATGAIGRARASLAALETLNRLRELGEPATATDRDDLAGWAGWGSLANAFEPRRAGVWAGIGERIEWLLPPEDQIEGRKATYSAFYTPPEITRACWQILQRLGFEGGRILEPGCGAGVFMEHTPAEIHDDVHWLGVERDPTTAAIASALHPKAKILTAPIQKARLPVASVDAVLGNVPFADHLVYDPTAPEAVRASLHNYCLWRSIQTLRPGGIAVLITSRYTLDAKDASARQMLFAHADLLGAIRLPSTVWQPGGTKVTADILVLRRRRGEEDIRNHDRTWLDTEEIPALNTTVNRLLWTRPDLVVGTMRAQHGHRYGHTLSVEFTPTEAAPTWQAGMAAAVYAVTAEQPDQQHRLWHVDAPIQTLNADTTLLTDADGRQEGSFHIIDGRAMVVVDGQRAAVQTRRKRRPDSAAAHSSAAELSAPIDEPDIEGDDGADAGGEPIPYDSYDYLDLGGKQLAELRALIELRDATVAVQAHELLALEQERIALRAEQRIAVAQRRQTAARHTRLALLLALSGQEGGRAVPQQQPHMRTVVLGALEHANAVAQDASQDEQQAAVERDTAIQAVAGFDAELVGMRERLNTLYDDYRSRYGFLNRVKISTGKPDEETGLPTIVKRRPPIMQGALWASREGATPVAVRFRTDPNYYDLLALEDWDGDNQVGHKHAIFTTRVNKAPQRITRADSAADAIALSLDAHNKLDLPTIAALLDITVDQVPDALGDLAYFDPATREWTERGEYLSGNVRDKLDQALAAAAQDPQRFTRNVEALRARQPRDLGPGEIYGQLGAAWIPEDDVAQFIRELLHPRGHVVVKREALTSTWTILLSSKGDRSRPEASHEWGTEAKDAYSLIELELNGSVPEVKTTVTENGKKTSVTDHEATAQAKARQKQIATRFSEWLWEDPDRSDRLAESYNRAFNATVLRDYDGSHLTVPGLAADFVPYASQRDMVFRAISNKTALCGHAVGGGKTTIMAMTAVKLRQLGLANKPMIVVLKATLEDIAREIRQRVPSAKLLVADEASMSDWRSRTLWAKRCATGDYDAVIITHPAFTKISMHEQYQAEYLADLAASYRASLTAAMGSVDAEDNETGLSDRRVKQVEKLIADLEARAEYQLQHASDSNISFEQLGVDYLLVDEFHYFKNLQVPCHTEGFSMSASKRASDLDMKLSWLRSQRDRVATFFSGTPVSNSMLELYVVLHYLMPERLEELGLGSPDAWARWCVQFEENLEIAPDGQTPRTKRRPTRFKNVYELLMLLNERADIRSKKQLGLLLPPTERSTEVVPRSRVQEAYITELAARAEAVKGKPPRKGADNILNIATDGRKCAIDPELVELFDPSSVKYDKAIDNIVATYRATKDLQFPADAKHQADSVTGQRGGFQLVFCDLGTPGDKSKNADKPAAIRNPGQVYAKIRDGLIAEGVPRERIRFIHDAKSDQQRVNLFADCRNGTVSVLIASTEKGGVGVNVQDRLVRMHHVDAPWRPSDIEQREGRGERPGNRVRALADLIAGMEERGEPVPDNWPRAVEITTYVTEGSFDSFMWGKLEYKAKFIGQLLGGKLDPSLREIEDVGTVTMNYAEVKALSTGNALLMDLAKAETQVKALQDLAAAHTRTQRRLESDINHYQKTAASNDTTAHALEAIAAAVESCIDDQRGFFTSSGDSIPDDDLDEVLANLAQQAVAARNEAKARRSAAEVQRGVEPVGKAHDVLRWNSMGLTFEVRAQGWRNDVLHALVRPHSLHSSVDLYRLELKLHYLNKGQHFRIRQALNQLIATCTDEANGLRTATLELRDRIEAARRQLGKPFPQLAELEAARADKDRINTELSAVKAAVDAEPTALNAHQAQARTGKVLTLARAAYLDPPSRRSLVELLTADSDPERVVQLPPRPRLPQAVDRPTAASAPGTPVQAVPTDTRSDQIDADSTASRARTEPGATITLPDNTPLSETRGPNPGSRAWTGTHATGVDILVVRHATDSPLGDTGRPWTYRLSRRTPDGLHLIGEPWEPDERWDNPTTLIEHLQQHVTAYTTERAQLPVAIVEARQELAALLTIAQRHADEPLLTRPTGETIATTAAEAAAYLERAAQAGTTDPVRWRGVDVRIDTIPNRGSKPDERTGAVCVINGGYRIPLPKGWHANPKQPISTLLDGVITQAEHLARDHDAYLATLVALSEEPARPVDALPNRPSPATHDPTRQAAASGNNEHRVPPTSRPASGTTRPEPTGIRPDDPQPEAHVAKPADEPDAAAAGSPNPDQSREAPQRGLSGAAHDVDPEREQRPPRPSRPPVGPWSRRIRIDVTGATATVSGTSRNDPPLLRNALKANGFGWKPQEGAVWRFTQRRRGPTRDEAVLAIRDVLAELDQQAAADSAPPTFPPTPQQQAIIDACLAGQTVAVSALAGTGKTSTLRMIAARMPDKEITYLAFNRAIADEAQAAFGPNVVADTMHAFARQALRSSRYQTKLGKVADKDGFPDEIAAAFGMDPDDEVSYGPRPDERIGVLDLMRTAQRVVKRFRESGDTEIGIRHLAADPTDVNPGLVDAALDCARRIWVDKTQPDGVLRFTHDDYLKIWALGNPRLPGDVIFFDEVQDSNELQAKLVQGQPSQIIVVGDSYQSIYGFRGARDYLRSWPAEVNLPLTQSWRFGPEVAATGNLFLRLLNSRLELEGNPALNSTIGTVTDPDAVLCRTNAGAVATVIAGLEAGKRVALVGGASAITDIAKAAKELQRGRRTKHPDLSMFTSWQNVRDYVNQDEDAQSLRMFVRLVDIHSPDGLVAMANDLVDEDETDPDFAAELVVSTAHKAKGREWKAVRIADDFKGPTEDPDTGETILPSAEELRLAYVTATRAKNQLDLGSLAWIDNYADQTTPKHSPQPMATHTAAELGEHSAQMHTGPSIQDERAEPAALSGPPADAITPDLRRDLLAVREEMLQELYAASVTHIREPGIGPAGRWDEAARTVTTDPDLPLPAEMQSLADLVDVVRVHRHHLAEAADAAHQHVVASATGASATTLVADARLLDALAHIAATCQPHQRGYLIPGPVVSTQLRDDQVEPVLLGFAQAAARRVEPSAVLTGNELLVPSDRITWREVTITFQTTPTGVCATLATAGHGRCDTVDINDEWLHDGGSGAPIRAAIEHAVTSAGARADAARRSMVDLVEPGGLSEPADAHLPTVPTTPDSGTSESTTDEGMARLQHNLSTDAVDSTPGPVVGGAVTDDDHAAPADVIEQQSASVADDVGNRRAVTTSEADGQTTVGPSVPVIEHNHSGTVVRGTSKEDLELRKMLTDNKFKYSTRQDLWFLGRQQRYGTRSFRIRNLIEALERAGREYELHEDETAATAESAPAEVPTAEAFISQQDVLATKRAMWSAFLASQRTSTGRQIINDWNETRPDGRALDYAADQVLRHGLDGEPQTIVDRYLRLFRTASTLHANLTAERKRAPQFMTNLSEFVKRSGNFAGRLVATIEAGDAHLLTSAPEPDATATAAPTTSDSPRSTEEDQLGFFDLTDEPSTAPDHDTGTPTAVADPAQDRQREPHTAESHRDTYAEHRPLQPAGDAAEDEEAEVDQPRPIDEGTILEAGGTDPDAALPSVEAGPEGYVAEVDESKAEEWERAELDALYAAEGWTFVDGLTGVSDLFWAHHWDLVEEVAVEVGGIYTEHWRRHDVSIGVSITPDDRVMTTVLLRYGPWESPHWAEVELTTAAAVRELIEQAGLHGVARPARLPGLWRIEGAYRAAGAVDAVDSEPGSQLVTRPADAVEEEAWYFVPDSARVPLAPPLPDVPVTTRAQVIAYVLGDHASDKRLRALVSVLLSGRSRNGITPDDAITGLVEHDPEIHRRAVAATAGRGDHGAAFDVARARDTLERLAEGDPTLPLNCLGEYIELAAPDHDEAETGPIRGVVVDVATHVDRVVVTIVPDGDSVSGARQVRQSFAVDAVVPRLDPALHTAVGTAPAPEAGLLAMADAGPDTADAVATIATAQPTAGVDGFGQLAETGSATTHLHGAMVQTVRFAAIVGWSTSLVTDTGIVLCSGDDFDPDPAAAIARHRAYVAAAADLQRRYTELVDRASALHTNLLTGGPGYRPPEPGHRFTALHEWAYFLHQPADAGLVDRLTDRTRQPEAVALDAACQRAINTAVTVLTAPEPVSAANLATSILATDEHPRNTAVRLGELLHLIEGYWIASPDAEPDQIAVCQQASGHLREVVELLVAATADRASLIAARVAGLLSTELDDRALEYAERALADGDHLKARERLAWSVSTHDPLNLVDASARQALRALLFSTDDQLADLVSDARAEDRADLAAETVAVLVRQLRRLASADTRLGRVLHGIQITEIADRLTSFAARLSDDVPPEPERTPQRAAEPVPPPVEDSHLEPIPAVPATVDATLRAEQLPVFANRDALIRYLVADRSADSMLRRLVLVELGGRARDGVYPGGAAQQLAALHPEVYRRTVTAAVGRTRRGVPFDLERAHAALRRLAEGDPTLPINTMGRYVELSEPDRSHASFRVENGQPVDTTPRVLVRGRVCEVRAEPTGVSVLIERDVTAVDGSPYAVQTVPTDTAIAVLDDTDQPTIDELWRRRRAMHPAIAEHARSLGLDPTRRAPTPAEALGRPGRPVDLDAALAWADQEITREREQLPPSTPDDTVPTDLEQVEDLLAAAIARERFLTNAAALISLATDDHYRLDGEVIDPDQIDHLLATHARAALDPDSENLSTVTWQGLWVHFRPATPEPGSDVVVVVVMEALGAQDTDGLSAGDLESGNESRVRTTVEDLVSAYRPARPARQAAVLRQAIAEYQARLAAETSLSGASAEPIAVGIESPTEDAEVPHTALNDQDIAQVLRHLLQSTLSEFVGWMQDPTTHRPPPNDQGFAGSRRSGEPDPGAHESVTVRSGRVEIDVHTSTEIRTGRPTWTTLARWLRAGMDPADLCLLHAVHAANYAVRFNRHGFTAIGETRLADAALRELTALRRTVTHRIIDRALTAHLAGTVPRRWRGPGPDPLLRAAAPTALAGPHQAAWDRITALCAVLPDRTEERRPLTTLAVGDVLLHPGHSGIPLRLTAITPTDDSVALTVTYLGPRWEPGEHTHTLPIPATDRAGNPATVDVVVAPSSLAGLVAEDQAPQPPLTTDMSEVDNRDSERWGFGGRVVQLQQRRMAPAPVSRGWDSADAIVKHLATMPSPHPAQARTETQLWEDGRTRLLAAIRAGRTAMSPGGTLLAYRARDDRTKRLSWVVVHAATGHPILTDRGAATAPLQPRPGRPAGLRPQFVDLPDALIPPYLDALERLADPRGHQIDWTLDFPTLQQSLRRWQDLEPDGALPEPGSEGCASGITGLHTAATFHAATGNPLAAAARGAFVDAVFEIASDRHAMWGHRHTGWVVETFGTVRRAFGRTDDTERRVYGRTDELRHHDPEQQRRAAREDRTTLATVRLAQARAFGGQPHQAVRDLDDRARAIQDDDENRPSRFSSAQLRSLISIIAELCSPVPTELDRLLTSQVGDHIVTPGPTGANTIGHTWVITRAAEPAGPNQYTARVDLLHADGPVHGTLDIDLTEGAQPVRIHYDIQQPDNPVGADRHDDHLTRVAAGAWALLPAEDPIPRTADAVHQVSRRALTAFLAADPSTATAGHTSPHPLPALGTVATPANAAAAPAEQHAPTGPAGPSESTDATVSTTSPPAAGAPADTLPTNPDADTDSAQLAQATPPELTTGEDAARYLKARHTTRDGGWERLLEVAADHGFYLQVAATSLAQVRDACRRLWPVALDHGFGLAVALDRDTLDDARGAGVVVHVPLSSTPDRDIAAVIAALRGYITPAGPIPGTTRIAGAVARSKTSPADPTPPGPAAAPQPQPATTDQGGHLPGDEPESDTTANRSDEAPARNAGLFDLIDPDAVQAAAQALDAHTNRETALELLWRGLPINQSRLDRPALRITGDVINGLARGAVVEADHRARQEIAAGHGLPTATAVAAIAAELDHRRSANDPVAQVLRGTRCAELVAQLYAIADHMALHGEFTVPGRPEMRHQLALDLFAAPSPEQPDRTAASPVNAAQTGSRTRRSRSNSARLGHAAAPAAPTDSDGRPHPRSEPQVAEPARNGRYDGDAAATQTTQTTGPSAALWEPSGVDTAEAAQTRPAINPLAPVAVTEPDSGARNTRSVPVDPARSEPASAIAGEALPSATAAAVAGPEGPDESAAGALRDTPDTEPKPVQVPAAPPHPTPMSTVDDMSRGPASDRPQPEPTGPTKSSEQRPSATTPRPAANGLTPAVLAMRNRLAAAGIDWPDTLTRFILANDVFDAQDHLRVLSRTTTNEPAVQTLAAMAWRAQQGQATREQIEHLTDRVLAGDPTLPAQAIGRQIRHPRSGRLYTVTAVRADVEGRLLVHCGEPRDPATVTISVDPDAWLNPTAPEVLPAATAFPLLARWEQLARLVGDHGYTLVEQPGTNTIEHDTRRIILGADTLAERLTRLADLVNSLPPSTAPTSSAPAATTATPGRGDAATEAATQHGSAGQAARPLALPDDPQHAAPRQPTTAGRATAVDIASDPTLHTPGYQRDLYVRVNEESMRWFYTQFTATPAAQKYLRDRLGGQDVVDRVRATRTHPEGFLIGYAPAGWTGLVDHLRALGIRDQDLVDAGVAIVSRRGTLVDRFRDRIMFGIRDAEGRLAGFTGRALSESDEVKYLNTPATPLFDKGSLLFGWSEQHALAGRADPVFVEGPFDVLAIAATNTADRPLLPVGICGTALTQRHLAAVDALIPTDRRRVFAFDADAGGRPAVLARAAEAVPAYPLLEITTLPDEMDPADWAKAANDDPNAAYREPPRTRPALQVLVDAIVDSWADQLRWAEGRIGAARQVASLLATVDDDRRTPLAVQIAPRLGLEVDQMATIVATALYERAHPAATNAEAEHLAESKPEAPGRRTTRAQQPSQSRPAGTGQPDGLAPTTGLGDIGGTVPSSPPTPTRRTRNTGATRREPPARHDDSASPNAQSPASSCAQQWTRLTRQASTAGFQVCTDFDNPSSVDPQARVIRINGHRDAATRVSELTQLLATLTTPTSSAPPEHETRPAQPDSVETAAGAPHTGRVASVAAPTAPIPEWMDPPLFRTLMTELGWDNQPDLLAGVNTVPVAWIPTPRQPLPECLTPIYDQLAREFWGEYDHRGDELTQHPTAPAPDPSPRTRTGRTRPANTNSPVWPGGTPVTTTPLHRDRAAGPVTSSHFVHAGITATRGRAR